jgi:hypothetical protein
MAVYKVSYVIIGNDYPGTILNQDHAPQPQEIVKLGDNLYRVVEALELVPPRGEFRYFHATCLPIQPAQEEEPE